MTWMTVDTRQGEDFSHLATALRGLAAAFRGAYRQYREDRLRRDAFLNLLTLDDATLDDIGVTREEVNWAARLPLEINAARALRGRTRPGAALACLTDK
jgi:uncharacterized protein YjiS (DUF1127 family)